MQMLEIKQLTRLQIIRYCEKLEKENKSLKESLYIATKCSSKEEDWIIRLSEENKKLKNLKICWKTVEERIEIDKGVVRVEE